MSISRYRQCALACGLFGLLLIGGSAPGQVVGDDPTESGTSAAESLLSGRPSPFYEADDPVVVPRSTLKQRIPARQAEASQPPAVSRVRAESSKIGSEFPVEDSSKTPLPESHVDTNGETMPASRERTGFGTSLAWAVGILAVGWLARQFLKVGGPLSSGATAAVQILSRQTIGPQQQLAVMRFGRRILLVGTTPTGMSTLATLDDPAEVQAIVAELLPPVTRGKPTMRDLFRAKRPDPRNESLEESISLSTTNRTLNGERQPSTATKREVADV